MTPPTYTQARVTPNGRPVTYVLREGTSDGALVESIIGHDEYGLASLPPLSGWAIDLGAHVGSVAIALAVDHPTLHVLAIDPVPENIQVIRQAAVINHVEDRIVVIEAAGGPPGTESAAIAWDYEWVEGVDYDHIRQSRFIGSVFRAPHNKTIAKFASVPVVNLPELVRKYERFCFLKTDCEGGEWGFLSEGADAIDLIVGEWHDRPWPAIADLLADTHDTERLTDMGGIGLFRAVHHHMRPGP